MNSNTAEFRWNRNGDCCLLGSTSIDRIVDLENVPFRANVIFPDANPYNIKEQRNVLGAHHFGENSFDLLLSFHAFLVRTNKHVILVDMCCGNDKNRPTRPDWHMQNGPFLENLASKGVFPEDVDFVMCTHLHADHVGWNTRLANDKWVPTFPNAQYIFNEMEFNYWKTLHDLGPAEPTLYGAYEDSILPVIKSGQAVLVNGKHKMDGGVSIEPAGGHTPGNAVVYVESESQRAVLCGDVIHHPVQLHYPEWATNFCVDPAQAIKTRLALLEEWGGSRTLVLPAHFQAPDYGRVIRIAKGFGILN